MGIIPGRKEHKNIDPYLEVLVDELLQLNGSTVFDAESFTLIYADILLHILNYPGQNVSWTKVFHCQGIIICICTCMYTVTCN